MRRLCLHLTVALIVSLTLYVQDPFNSIIIILELSENKAKLITEIGHRTIICHYDVCFFSFVCSFQSVQANKMPNFKLIGAMLLWLWAILI